MQSIARRFVRPMLTLVAAAYSGLAPAAYVFNSIDYPGAQFTQTYGINNNGQIAINANIGGVSASFVYQGGSYNALPAPPTGVFVGAVGLNDSDTVVGGASDATGVPEQG